MLRSLYSGVSGMSAHQTKMDVIGNNIANVSTYGFKASRVTFSDVYYQTVRNATAGSTTTGGNNASQIGYGSQVGSIDTLMSQSGFQSTSNSLDLAIAGDGFFQVQDKAGNIFYTRAGVLSIDDTGNLVDNSGNFVLGITGDPTGQAASAGKIQIIVPNVDNASSSASKTLGGSAVTVACASVGDVGNITVNFVHADTPTASLSGTNLTVYFDQKARYDSIAQLQAAVSEAIQLGGVTLPAGAINLSVDPAPANTIATATNTVSYSAGMPATTAANTTTYPGGDLTITAGAAGTGGNDISVAYTNIATGGTASAEWVGDALTFTLVDGASYSPADLQALANGATGTAPMSVAFSGTATAIDTADLIATTTSLSGGAAAAPQSLTVTAGKEGKNGNNIGIAYTTPLPAGNTASAKWEGDVLMFTLVEGQTYSAADLNALASAAETAAGITAGDFKDVTITGTITAVSPEELATKPVKLLGGDNTYFTNIAGLLGTMKLEGGLTAAEQTVGNLSSISIGSDGVITATHSVHGMMTLGRIDIATFDNPEGLAQMGDNYFAETAASGKAKLCEAGFDGAGDIVSNSLEMSNVDLAQEFADMITTQRGFQANARIITTSDEILQELVNLKR